MKTAVLLIVCAIVLSSAAKAQSIADRFDMLEREETAELLEKAKRCADLNDFVCSDRYIAAANKIANGGPERARIAEVSSDASAKRDQMESKASEDDESHDRRLRASVARSQRQKIAAQRQALRDERQAQQARRAEYARAAASSMVHTESERSSSSFTLTAVNEVERPPVKNSPFVNNGPPVGKILVVPIIDPKTVGSRRTSTGSSQTTSR